jgi:transposase InsO family protein
VFWLAAVWDAFSNRIVGWKTSHRCDTDLILAALEYGIWSHDVRDQQLIHHSDRGSPSTSPSVTPSASPKPVRLLLLAVKEIRTITRSPRR